MTLRKHIPNSITSMNLLCGVLGVIFSLDGKLETAFVLMLLAAVFDFCDGLSARLLKAYSDVGKELDSLSDVVSFGVLPSVMLYCVFGTQSQVLRLFPLLIAAFSALRLAKFNLDERQHDSFIGLPTPACAMVCGSLACFAAEVPGSFISRWCEGPFFIVLLTVLLCALLGCEIPMFSFKFGGGRKASRPETVKRIVFLAVAVLGTLVTAIGGWHWSLVFLVAFAGYIIINLLSLAFVRK